VLHEAASSGSEGIVRLLVLRLVELNGDVDTPDSDGRTALYRAATNGHNGVVATLVAAGADIVGKPKAYQRTALRVAVDRGHEEVLDVLLAAGCKPSGSELRAAAMGAIH
jgi:ankyrin repeat protein